MEMKRLTLAKAIEKAKTLALSGKLGDNDIEVGSYFDFNANEFKDIEDSLFIDNDTVFLVKFGLSYLHELTAYTFTKAVDSALGDVNAKHPFTGSGSAQVQLVNYLGCGKSQLKQPDGSFSFIDQSKRCDPFMVLEIACCNESLSTLLKEGACWLNESTETVFALLIKLHVNDEKFRGDIYLMQRTAPLALFNGVRGTDGRVIGSVADLVKLPPKWSANQIKNNLNQLEQMLKVRIVHHLQIDDETGEIALEFEVNPIFECLDGDPLESQIVRVIVPSTIVACIRAEFYRSKVNRDE